MHKGLNFYSFSTYISLKLSFFNNQTFHSETDDNIHIQWIQKEVKAKMVSNSTHIHSL